MLGAVACQHACVMELPSVIATYSLGKCSGGLLTNLQLVLMYGSVVDRICRVAKICCPNFVMKIAVCPSVGTW